MAPLVSRDLFLFVMWKFQVKKIPEKQCMRVRPPPPAVPTLVVRPQLAAAGAKNQSPARAIRAQADKGFTPAGQSLPSL